MTDLGTLVQALRAKQEDGLLWAYGVTGYVLLSFAERDELADRLDALDKLMLRASAAHTAVCVRTSSGVCAECGRPVRDHSLSCAVGVLRDLLALKGTP